MTSEMEHNKSKDETDHFLTMLDAQRAYLARMLEQHREEVSEILKPYFKNGSYVGRFVLTTVIDELPLFRIQFYSERDKRLIHVLDRTIKPIFESTATH